MGYHHQTEYVKTTVSINFVPEHVGCRWCPLLETYSRPWCKRTGELIVDVDTIGYGCPLKIEGEGEDNG